MAVNFGSYAGLTGGLFGAKDWGTWLKNFENDILPQLKNSQDYQAAVDFVRQQATQQGEAPGRVEELVSMFTGSAAPIKTKLAADDTAAANKHVEEAQKFAQPIMDLAKDVNATISRTGGETSGQLQDIYNRILNEESVNLLGGEARTGDIGRQIATNALNANADAAERQGMSATASAQGASGIAMAQKYAADARANQLQSGARDVVNTQLQSRLGSMNQYANAQNQQLNAAGGTAVARNNAAIASGNAQLGNLATGTREYTNIVLPATESAKRQYA